MEVGELSSLGKGGDPLIRFFPEDEMIGGQGVGPRGSVEVPVVSKYSTGRN